MSKGNLGGRFGYSSASWRLESVLQAVPIHCAIVLLLPIGLALANDGWLYSRVWYIDTWQYLGYAFHYSDPSFSQSNAPYKISRLPWILTEYSVHKFLPPILANFILQIGCLSVAALAVYASLRTTLAALPALLGASLLCVFTWFHGSGGADYHNTLAGPLYALSFLAATRAARASRAGLWFLAAGTLFGLTVHTNIVFANLAPVLVGHVIVTNRLAGRPSVRLPRMALLSVLGIIGVTLVLGCINVAFGRDFFFFLPGFQLAISFVADPAKQRWWKPWGSYWYLQEAYLGLLAVQVLASVGCAWRALAQTARSAAMVQAVSLNLQFLFAALLWLVWQAAGQTALDWSYFAYPLFIPFAMSVAACVHICTKAPTTSGGWALTFAAVVVCMLCPLVFLSEPLTMIRLQFKNPLIAAALPFAIALGCLFVFGRRIGGLLLTIVMLGLANAIATAEPAAYALSTCRDRRDAYLAIIDAHEKLLRLSARERVHVWYDENEKADYRPNCVGPVSVRDLGMSIGQVAFQFIELPWPMKPIDRLDDENLRNLAKRNGVVALVTNDARHVESIRKRYAEMGLALRLVATEHVLEGGIAFAVFVLAFE